MSESINYTLTANMAEGERRANKITAWVLFALFMGTGLVAVGEFALLVLIISEEDKPPLVLQQAMEGGLEVVRLQRSDWFEGLDLATKQELALGKTLQWLEYREGYFAPTLNKDKFFMRTASTDEVYEQYLQDVKKREKEFRNYVQLKVSWITAEAFDDYITVKMKVTHLERNGPTREPSYYVATVSYRHDPPQTLRKRTLKRLRHNIEGFRVTAYRISTYNIGEDKYARTD